MVSLVTFLQYLPHLVTTLVLGGIALYGWRRTRATGALIIAVGAAVNVVHYVVWMLLWQTAYRRASYSVLSWIGALQVVGGLVAAVLFIVGVALLLKRLPSAQSPAQRRE
jgi:hypothetical protein